MNLKERLQNLFQKKEYPPFMSEKYELRQTNPKKQQNSLPAQNIRLKENDAPPIEDRETLAQKPWRMKSTDTPEKSSTDTNARSTLVLTGEEKIEVMETPPQGDNEGKTQKDLLSTETGCHQGSEQDSGQDSE